MKDNTNPKDLAGQKKTPITLLPSEGIRQGALAMKHGADKYGAYNWRDKNVQARIYADAIIRHVLEWVDGVDTDRDSGLHPLAHVIANGALVLDALKHGNLIDNRPSKLFPKASRDNLADKIKRHNEALDSERDLSKPWIDLNIEDSLRLDGEGCVKLLEPKGKIYYHGDEEDGKVAPTQQEVEDDLTEYLHSLDRKHS
jgi:hypothetical protein